MLEVLVYHVALVYKQLNYGTTTILLVNTITDSSLNTFSHLVLSLESNKIKRPVMGVIPQGLTI